MSSKHKLAEQLAATKGWDNLVRQLMLAGKEIIPLDTEARTDENEVKGCQSRVWLTITPHENGVLTMQAWSDSKIIRGVLAVIQEQVNQLSPQALERFDFDHWFTAIQLERYLSQSRANGIAEVVKRLKQLASGLM